MSDKCIRNVFETASGVEVVLVHNGSRYPAESVSCKSVYNDVNLGVAVAWNQGVENSEGEYIVFLNSDCFPHGDWVGALIEGLKKKRKKKRIGAISPTMCEEDERERIESNCGEFGGGCSGSCFMMNRKLLEKVGKFDERFYPAYYEDFDMWKRLEQHGYVTANTTRACMTHLHSQSFDQYMNHDAIKSRNKRLYEEKWHGR